MNNMIYKKYFLIPALIICLMGLLLTPSRQAQASCACALNVAQQGAQAGASLLIAFNQHKDYITNILFSGHIYPSLVAMGEQISATILTQSVFTGMFFDAQHQLDRQLALNQYHVAAVKNYQPSAALCKFGTATLGLASSDQNAGIIHEKLMKRALDRQLGTLGLAAASDTGDLDARIDQFAKVYCNPNDNKGFLAGASDAFCKENGGDPARYNKDINYTKTFDTPLTLDLNLNDGDNVTSPLSGRSNITPDTQDILALGNNLFSYNLFKRPARDTLKDSPIAFHAARSVVAKRNLAENSFYAIAAQKAKGSGAGAAYIKQMVEALGMSAEDANDLLGENPSYFAQMEVLTKKLYQDPNFVVSLVDKPANVDRQKAAMQSFRLMQQRDFYESLIRQEMVLSVILEELIYNRYKSIVDDGGK